MIDPKDFLSSDTATVTDDIVEIDGTFSCPERDCYERARQGLLNPNTRVVTWICSNGHQGKATI